MPSEKDDTPSPPRKFGRSIPFEWSKPTTPEEMRFNKQWREGLRTPRPATPDPTPQDEIGLSLEVGKSYRNQKGDVIKICEEIIVAGKEDKFYHKLGWVFKDTAGRRYRSNGSARLAPSEPTTYNLNLIEEIS